MIFHRLRLINKNQRGFTLIEILVALAITGLITGGITGTIFQVITIEARTSNHMTAVRQVQNAGFWVSRDATMAQTVDLEWQGETPSGSKFPLKLTWTEWDNNEKYEVIYTLQNMIGGPKQLQRQHLTYDADGYEIGNETTILAQYIIPGVGQTRLDFTDGKLTLTVTATVERQSETRTYEVIPRPGM